MIPHIGIWSGFDKWMQKIAGAILGMSVGASLYFHFYMLLSLIKICWRHICNPLSINALFLNELIFVVLFAERFHCYKEPVTLHVLLLPFVSLLCWWNSIENLSPMIFIWCEQEHQKFVYVIAFLLNLLWSLNLLTILLNPINHISYKKILRFTKRTWKPLAILMIPLYLSPSFYTICDIF